MLPSWLPTVGIEGGEINIVPVDFVADAIDHIAHQPDLDGQAFSLTDPNPKTAGEVLNLFAKEADAPQAAYRLDSGITDPATNLIKTGLRLFPPAKRVAKLRARRGRHPRRRPHLRQLPDPLRLDQRPGGAGGLGDRGAAAGDLRGPDLGLLGAQPRPGPVQGPLAGRRGAGQDRPGHRRLVGDRQSDRGQGRRRRRHGAARRPHGREARRDQRRDRARRRRRPHPQLRHVGRRGRRADGRRGAHLPRPRRHPRQQRRALDPPLGRARLRPLPRLRADDASQLLRRRAADPGAAAGDAGAQVGPHHQHQLDRDADQPAALLRLRRLEGGARRLQPRDRLRGDRRRAST